VRADEGLRESDDVDDGKAHGFPIRDKQTGAVARKQSG
jgi:hypothetical protein